MLNTLQLPAEWSTLKKLIWLRGSPASGGMGSETLSLTAFAAPTLKTVTKKSKVTSCEVSFTPYQDLHGYDSPWPAGGGVNVFDEEMELGILNSDGTISASTTRLVNKNYMPITPEVTYCYSWNLPSDSSTARPRAAFYDSSYQLVSYIGDLGSTPTNVNNRLVSTFTTPASAVYLKFCMYTSYGVTYMNDITFNVSNESYNGKYYPYSNLCPISGWQGAEVYIEPTYDPTATPKASVTFGVQGKNLFNKNDSGIETGKALSTTGGNVYNASAWSVSPYIAIKPNEYYIISSDGTEGLDMVFYNANKEYISGNSNGRNPNKAPANASYVRFDYRTTWLDVTMLEQGQSASAYEPYRDYILGGTAEIVAGTGSEQYAEVDMGSLTWEVTTLTTTRQAWATFDLAFKAPVDANHAINAFCTIAKSVSYNDTWTPYVISNTSNNLGLVLCTEPNKYSDATELQTALNGVKLVYELATPTPFTFPPASDQLLLQKGDNYNWAEMTND